MKKIYTEMPIMLAYFEKWEMFKDAPRTVPFELLNEEWAQKNHMQTLQRLAERGGLGPDEIVANINKRPWCTMHSLQAFYMIKEAMKQTCECCGVTCTMRYKVEDENGTPLNKEGKPFYLCCECAA